MSYAPGQDAAIRWGDAALKVAQRVRSGCPGATRGKIIEAILQEVPSAPRGARTLERAVEGWIDAGELPPVMRKPRAVSHED